MSTVLNRSSVKKYALKVSTERRAGKFTRVGEEFFLRCEANLESAIRGIVTAYRPVGPEFMPATEETFITATARAKAEEMLGFLAQRIIYREVLRQPSLGCTLK